MQPPVCTGRKMELRLTCVPRLLRSRVGQSLGARRKARVEIRRVRGTSFSCLTGICQDDPLRLINERGSP